MSFTQVLQPLFFCQGHRHVFTPLMRIPKKTLPIKGDLPAGNMTHSLAELLPNRWGLSSPFHDSLTLRLAQSCQDFVRCCRQMANTRAACVRNRIHHGRSRRNHGHLSNSRCSQGTLGPRGFPDNRLHFERMADRRELKALNAVVLRSHSLHRFINTKVQRVYPHLLCQHTHSGFERTVDLSG